MRREEGMYLREGDERMPSIHCLDVLNDGLGIRPDVRRIWIGNPGMNEVQLLEIEPPMDRNRFLIKITS